MEIHYPAKNDGKGTGHSQFDFAFQFQADGQDYLTDKTAFEFTINLVEQEWVVDNGVSKPFRNYTEIEYELCGETNLNFDDLAEIKRLGLENYY